MSNEVHKKYGSASRHKLIVRVVAVVLAAVFVLMLASQIFLYALAEDSSSVDSLKARQAALQTQAEECQSQLDALAEEEAAAVDEYQLLEEQNQILANQIDAAAALISSYDEQIEATTAELGQAEEEHEAYYELYCQRVSQMEQGGTISIWEMVFSSSSITELLTALDDMNTIVQYDNDILQQMTDLETEISEKESELAEAREEQEAVLAQLQAEQEQMQENEDQAAAVLAEIEDNMDLYAQQLNAVTVECSDLEADILEAETLAAQKAAEEAAALQAEQEAAAAAEAEAQKAAEQEAQEAAEREAAAAAEAEAQVTGESEANLSAQTDTAEESSAQTTDTADETPAADSSLDAGAGTEEAESSSASSSSSDNSSASPSSGVTGADVVAYAVQFVGNPYVWGGTSLTNGCDCSGFVVSVYAHFGYSLPHFSGSLRYCGTGVSYSEAQPGDIICYDGHVGIYMGGGQMVNAFDTSHGIIICSVNTSKLTAVRRILT